jgi:hypothetical protein
MSPASWFHQPIPWVLIALLSALLTAASGCGSSVPYRTVPVSGKITYDDGSLINAPRIQLIFWSQAEPIDLKTKPRQGVAEVDPADGTFSEASTWALGDGVIIGKQKICVITYDEKGAMTNLLPEVYNEPSDTPLEVEVSKAEGMAPRELKVKKKG